MFNQQKAKQIENVSFLENLRKQELIDSEKAFKNRQWSIILLSIIGVVLVISVILFRNNRIQNKANRLLSKQKLEIELQRTKVENTLNELESTQMQLVQKEKLASLGEITAGIAHEIQNPLNFVNNFSELSIELADELKKEFDKIDIPVERKEYLEELLHDLTQNQERIHGHGKRASSIVSNMLEHSRSSDGETHLTDINKLAEEYLSLSFHGMRAKNKSFNADYQLVVDKNLPEIKVNQQDVGRVLLNLFNNAFYAASQSENPAIKVITKKDKEYLIIEVIDNGKGIPKDILLKIFQPFFTTKPTGEGTGLGLSLSYDIITKGNNGKIDVLSEEGEGATFIIKLPLNK
jgi:two-component system, NtrC family, sensor kinase